MAVMTTRTKIAGQLKVFAYTDRSTCFVERAWVDVN